MRDGWRQKIAYKYRHVCPICGRVFYCNGLHTHKGDSEPKHKCSFLYREVCRCPRHSIAFECDVMYEGGLEPASS